MMARSRHREEGGTQLRLASKSEHRKKCAHTPAFTPQRPPGTTPEPLEWGRPASGKPAATAGLAGALRRLRQTIMGRSLLQIVVVAALAVSTQSRTFLPHDGAAAAATGRSLLQDKACQSSVGFCGGLT